MAASVPFRPHNRDLGMAMREVDEDLAIFLGSKNGEKEKNDHLLVEYSNEFDNSSKTKPDPIVANDNLLNLEIENQRSDCNWLTPEKIDGLDSALNQTDLSKDEIIYFETKLANSCENRRPSSSRDRKANSRGPTPTRRPSLPAKSGPSRASTPTSRAALEPSRASLRATSTSSKPVGAQRRSSTPSKSTSRSSTPSTRPMISKPRSRPATPTRKQENAHSTVSSVSSSDRSALKNPQMVKSRPSRPSEILSLSHDAPQNPKTSMPIRPSSASRGRPGSSSNGKPRQKSCSPAKTRASNGPTAHKIGSAMLSRSRSYNHNGGDDVNPVLMGTKMVERVVNMRKLAPPKQDERVSLDNTRKTSIENSGFGRSLSKRSLDMAIRHMDIRRSIPDNLRPVSTSLSSSSQSSAIGFSDSPVTSASESSESSNCVNSCFLDRRRRDD